MKSKLAENLESLRVEKGWTKTKVSKILGLPAVSTYANWEYGTREPDAKMLIKIAELYNVSIDFLLGRTDIRESYTNLDKEFKEDILDPDLKVWWKSLPKSKVEELRQLKEMWDILKK